MYNIGCTLFAAATVTSVLIGDGRWPPVVNHVSSSATQKFASSCTAMAFLSVNIMSSWVVYAMPCSVRYFVTLFPLLLSLMLGIGVSSKFISENTGLNSGIIVSKSLSDSIGISKSFGNGICPTGCNSGAVGCARGADVMLLISNPERGKAARLFFARVYIVRISCGMFGGNSGA